MSAREHAHDAHGHGDGHPHGSLRDYVIGFLLSVVLTAIPFWLVMNGGGDGVQNKQLIAFVIMAFAAIQMVVHMVFFLHMSPKAEEGWTMVSLIFTLILVVITLAGSLWVMHHLDTNMMPRHEVAEPF